MPLLNYTTTINSAKTAAEIQNILAKHGATSIIIKYEDGWEYKHIPNNVMATVITMCEFVMKSSEIRFLRGRLKFNDSQNSAPFPSAIAVFSQEVMELNI